MVDKMVDAVKFMDLEFDSVVIEGIDEDVTRVLTEAFRSDGVRAAMEKKLIETIEAIDPVAAAKKLEMTWGELIGEFLYKIVNTFKPRKQA